MDKFLRAYVARNIIRRLPAQANELPLWQHAGQSDSRKSANDVNNSNNDANYYFIAQQQAFLLDETSNDDTDYQQDSNLQQNNGSDMSHVLATGSSYTTTTAAAGAAATMQDYYDSVHTQLQQNATSFLTLYSNYTCNGDQQAVGNLTLNGTLPEPEEDIFFGSAYFQALVYLLYIPIFLFALLGNGLVCYIVQSTPRMRTVTNYFIANLALGDILMSLFCVPTSFISNLILTYWPFGIALCYMVNYSQAVSVLVTAYTLVAISIDRYIAIMWPLRPRITKRHAKLLIAGVWGIALVTAFPIPVVSQLTQPTSWHKQCDRYICNEVWPTNDSYYYYTLALFTSQFVIPLLVLIFTYTRIALAVWGKRPPGEAENSRDQRMARSKRKMIKMMVTVVIVFTICWLPFNILLLLNDDNLKAWEPLPYVWTGFHWLAMSHSCYNPIIYCYMNARFRGGFLQIIYRVPGLRRCCCLRRYLNSRGERGYEPSGEMTFKFNGDYGGGLKRKPKIRIRNHRRCLPPTACEHMHNVHQHKTKAAGDFYASESIFMCGNHSVAVVPDPQDAETS